MANGRADAPAGNGSRTVPTPTGSRITEWQTLHRHVKEVLSGTIRPDGRVRTPLTMLIGDLPDLGQHPNRTIALRPGWPHALYQQRFDLQRMPTKPNAGIRHAARRWCWATPRMQRRCSSSFIPAGPFRTNSAATRARVGDKPHRYHFQVLALDTMLDVPAGADRDQLLAAAKGHVIAKGQLMDRFQQKLQPPK